MSFVTVEDEVGLEDFTFAMVRDPTASVRQMDKARARRKKKTMLVYTAGVVNPLVTCFMVAGVPWALPFYYTAKAPVLLGLRAVQ